MYDNLYRYLAVVISSSYSVNWGGGGVYIHIFVFCPTISFEINLKTTDFKRNSSGIAQIYEYTGTPPPPPPPISALATALPVVWPRILLPAHAASP